MADEAVAVAVAVVESTLGTVAVAADAAASESARPDGLLRLRAVRSGGRTTLAEVARTAPFHPSPAAYRDGVGTAEVTIQAVGPGLFPGERLVAEVVVEGGARLVVRGQGATKAYPSPGGEPAVSICRLRVAAGGSLVWLPGELIPFRDAVVRQETTAEVAAGGRLALLDLLTPGRVARGERDAYRRLELRLRVVHDGRPLLTERARLEPGRRPLTVPGRHGSFGCVGTLVLVGWGEAAGSLGQGTGDDPVWWGSGGEGELSLVRLVGPTAQGVRRVVDGLLARLA